MQPSDCQNYIKCNAMLCPLDKNLKKRIWYTDEDICSRREHNKRRWIKKQRMLRRKQHKSYKGKPITFQRLYDTSRPKKRITR